MDNLLPRDQKIIRYVQERKIPPSVAQIALHIPTSRQNAHRLLTSLVRKGYIKSIFKQLEGKKAERRYVMPDSPLADPPKPVKPKKPKYNFYNDPFNLARKSDATKDNI